jgi:hypothetical protein
MTVNANQPGKYGVYQLQPDLIAVPQALANRNNSHKGIGNMTLRAGPKILDSRISG